MFYFFLPFLVTALILLILGIIRPSIVNQLLSIKLTRIKIILIFGAMAAIFAFSIVVTTPRTTKEDIAGVNTIQPIKSNTGQVGGSTSNQKSEPEVKKSSTGICHLRGSKYYDLVTEYKSFSSLEICLRGGGRLPKK